MDVRALEARRRRLAERRRELVLSDDDFSRDALKDLADEDARLARQIQAAAAPRVEADTEALLLAAVEAARRLEAPDTDEGRDALRAVLRAFLKDVTIMPGEMGAKLKPVKMTVYTPKGVAAVIGAPGSST